MQILAVDDIELWGYIEDEYGEVCTIDDCRRHMEEDDNFRPFTVKSVVSTINETEMCEPAGVNTTCHVINTAISVKHYPTQFPKKRVELICIKETMDFMEENSIAIRNLGDIPQIVETKISLTFKGVDRNTMTEKEMTDEETEEFVDATYEFLQDILGR